MLLQRLIRLAMFSGTVLFICPMDSVSAQSRDSLRLTLPPAIYGVPGVEMNLHFANTVLVDPEQQLVFEVDSVTGDSNAEQWTLTPEISDIGTSSLTLRVKDTDGHLLDAATTSLTIVPADSGANKEIRLLLVGDSLTHASVYPNEIARLLNGPGNPKWRMLGTHKPSSAADGVFHEGYGGWTWSAFNSKFALDASKPGSSSPFVFAQTDGGTSLNATRYFDERCEGLRPDFIVIKLGINDCFGFDSDDPTKLASQIDKVFQQAEILLAEFRRVTPDSEIGICLTTPGNSRDEAFVANYKDRYTRSGWRRIQHRLVERQLAHFGKRESENIFIVPTELNLDVVDGYPANNAVHPNALGYHQIGRTIYSWLKWRLASNP